MTGAFINNTFNAQLPCGKINIFDLSRNDYDCLQWRKCLLFIKVIFAHLIFGHFEQRRVSVIDENVQALFCNVAIETITWNVSIIACILRNF